MLIISYFSDVDDSPPHQDEDDLPMPMPLIGCEPCEASNDTAELVTLHPHRNYLNASLKK